MSEITKQKAGKPDWTQILGPLRHALEAMVRVREYGNQKYARIAKEAGVAFDPESWAKNSVEDYLASAARHIVAACAGARINSEDGGVHHMAQAMVDLGFAFEIEHRGERCPHGDKLADAAGPLEPSCGCKLGEADAPRPFIWGGLGERILLDPRHPDELPDLWTLVITCANIKRWNGHWPNAISVTRHCSLVHDLLPEGVSNEMRKAALAHDLHEALYCDLPSPLKKLVGPNKLTELCDRFDRLLERALGLRELSLASPTLKEADKIANCAEAYWLGIPHSELVNFYGLKMLETVEELKPPALSSQESATSGWYRRWESL